MLPSKIVDVRLGHQPDVIRRQEGEFAIRPAARRGLALRYITRNPRQWRNNGSRPTAVVQFGTGTMKAETMKQQGRAMMARSCSSIATVAIECAALSNDVTN